MFHARLDPAGENSGKLVSLVRQRARAEAEAIKADWLIVDGPPGIGCPVIASITGADAILAVTEPGISSQHDLLRLLELTTHFGVPAMVMINKWDINPAITDAIEEEARRMHATPVGRMHWAKEVVDAQLAGLSLPEYLPEGDILDTITQTWEKICQTTLR
jgi:MinD superfamily P-loop ATPase